MVRRLCGYGLLLAALAMMVGSTATAESQRHADAGRTTGPGVRLFPSVAMLGHGVRIRVTGVAAPSLEVNVAGGTSVLGKPLHWKRLAFSEGAWRGALPLPVRRGIYVLELRVRAGAPVMSSERWVLRVFARGTESRPAFGELRRVAAWWVRITHPGGVLVATRSWRLSVDDLRDPRRHQRLVIAYTIAGHRAERLGVFLTAVRARPHGRWRLLEASVTP